jgi:uncharacterized OB-fold protein
MTLFTSHTQYQCKRCGQIHVKPEHGSISIFVPVDIVFKPTDVKTCKGCGEQQEVQEYTRIGRVETFVEIDTYPKHPTMWQRLRRKLDDKYCKKDVYATEMYPRM